MIHLNVAKETDLNGIAKMAAEIWNVHYVDVVGQEQVNYMLKKIYNIQSLLEQLNEKKHVFYLLEKHKNIIGFLSVSSQNNYDFFIHKFYIYQNKSNCGLGTETLNALINITKAKTLTLTVNRQNYKSINFYFKNNFKITKVEDIDIEGGFIMNDFVMQRVI